MTATLLCNVDQAAWALGPAKSGKVGATFPLRLGDGLPAIQLVPGDCHDISTPFPPSVFQGTGEEPRQTLTLNIPEGVFSTFATLEDTARGLLAPRTPTSMTSGALPCVPPGTTPRS